MGTLSPKGTQPTEPGVPTSIASYILPGSHICSLLQAGNLFKFTQQLGIHLFVYLTTK